MSRQQRRRQYSASSVSLLPALSHAPARRQPGRPRAAAARHCRAARRLARNRRLGGRASGWTDGSSKAARKWPDRTARSTPWTWPKVASRAGRTSSSPGGALDPRRVAAAQLAHGGSGDARRGRSPRRSRSAARPRRPRSPSSRRRRADVAEREVRERRFVPILQRRTARSARPPGGRRRGSCRRRRSRGRPARPRARRRASSRRSDWRRRRPASIAPFDQRRRCARAPAAGSRAARPSAPSSGPDRTRRESSVAADLPLLDDARQPGAIAGASPGQIAATPLAAGRTQQQQGQRASTHHSFSRRRLPRRPPAPGASRCAASRS